MQKPSGRSIAKWALVGGMIALIGYGGYIGWRSYPSTDNPDRLGADYSVIQDWEGVETSGYINDHWNSEIQVHQSDASAQITMKGFGVIRGDHDVVMAGSGAPIGTMKLSDRGRGETMSAYNPNGTLIASWNEEVNREGFGPFFSGVFNMPGMLKGNIGGKDVVVMPESIPSIGRDYTVRIGIADENGVVTQGTESVAQRGFDGWFGEARDSTAIQNVKMVNGEPNVDKVLSSSKHDWFFRGGMWPPEEIAVKDANGNVIYTVKGYYWDENPRSEWDGYNFFNAKGQKFAQIDVVDPDNVKQVGYKFLVDKDGDGSLEEAATFYFNARQREIGEDSNYYMWAGELWAHLKGDTHEEKMANLQHADNVMKLLGDVIPEDNDGSMFNIEEYTDFLLLFTDTQENGLAKPERLANAATTVDTLDYEKALNELVYRSE